MSEVAMNDFTLGEQVACERLRDSRTLSLRLTVPATDGHESHQIRTGSGFLVVGSALIVTAHHVIKGAPTVTVRFPSGHRRSAVVVDQDAKNDIVVLTLPGFDASGRGFSLGVYVPVAAGETVHAMGYPLSSVLGKRPSIVSGQVSATAGLEDSPTEFRMTAPINPGNSGGPIINQYGEVVGIAQSTLRGTMVEGIGFGVKIAVALPLLQQVGVKLDQRSSDEIHSAAQLFADRSIDVVLIEAK